MDIAEKCALVTDGTNGVGFAFAVELLRKKAKVLRMFIFFFERIIV